MRLRPWRRSSGSVAAHNSRYGPQRPPTITLDQHEAIYLQIIDLTRSVDIYPFDEQGVLTAAGRPVLEEFTDNLHLVLDGLDLSKAWNGSAVELNLPAEQLRRTFIRLRKRAVEQREANSEGSAVIQSLYERALIVIETCDQVLADVGDDAQAATG